MSIPKWALKLPWPLIREKSLRYSLDPYLVAAIVETESGGNPNAIRFEPLYSYTWETLMLSRQVGCTEVTMVQMQKISWGLMQIMGGVAYELGLHHESHPHDRWATALLDPELNLEYGCKFLKQKILDYGDDPATVYAAYNAGSPRKKSGMFVNQRNVDRFYKLYRQLIDIK